MTWRLSLGTGAALVRPPGRRGALWRLAPEICAGGCYLVGVLTMLALPGLHLASALQAPFIAAAVAYALSCVLLVVMPVIWGAESIAGEKSGGTAEALLLTPVDRRRLAWGRYWHVLAPWVRFMLWVSPLYVLMALNGIMSELNRGSSAVLGSTLIAAGPKGLVAAILFTEGTQWHRISAWGLILMGLRFWRDLLSLALTCALAFYISVRASGSGRALLIGFLVVLPGLAVVFCIPEWLIFVIGPLPELIGLRHLSVSERTAGPIYFGLSLLGLGFEMLAAPWLVSRAARNFDAWAAGEGGAR